MTQDNLMAKNVCRICFLYHFDLGSPYLIEGIHKKNSNHITNVNEKTYFFEEIEKKLTKC